MTQPGDAQLLKALDLASGRRVTGARPPEAARAYAEELLEARERLEAAPRCPNAVLRRAQALFAVRRPSLGASLLRLVFDSWKTEPVPAFRGGGAPRTLRFEGKDRALDVRVARDAGGRRRLQVAVEGGAPNATAVVRAPNEVRGRNLRLGPDGVGQLLLPTSIRTVEIEVHEGDVARVRTPRLDLEELEA